MRPCPLWCSCDFYVNPLTTNDDCSCHWNFYQLAQSILKIGSALAEGVGWGEVGGGWQCMVGVATGCRKALVNARWAILLSWTNGPKKMLLSLCTGSSWHFWQLSVERSALWSEGPDYWILANEWMWSRSWTCKERVEEAVSQVSRTNSQQIWKYGWKKVWLV